MNSFNIIDENNIPLTITQLDIEAAIFWGKPVDKIRYADPTPNFKNNYDLQGQDLKRAMNKYNLYRSLSWFDTIGWLASEGYSWKEMKEDLAYNDEYVNLITYWENKKYKPECVKTNTITRIS